MGESSFLPGKSVRNHCKSIKTGMQVICVFCEVLDQDGSHNATYTSQKSGKIVLISTFYFIPNVFRILEKQDKRVT